MGLVDLINKLHFCAGKNKPGATVETAKGKDVQENGFNNIAAQTFTFRELATATKNFRPECLIGEGGFGRVYKGELSTGQVPTIYIFFCGASAYMKDIKEFGQLTHVVAVSYTHLTLPTKRIV